jgi:hypothetical protein
MIPLYLMFLLAQSPATPCDRATALTIRIVRDNTALLTGERAMGESERKAVERELRKASKACKERGDGK